MNTVLNTFLKSLFRICLIAVCVSFVSYYLLQYVPGNSQDVLYALETPDNNLADTDNTDKDNFVHNNSIKTSFSQFVLQSSLFVSKYNTWFIRVLKGDLGTSSLTGQNINSILFSRAKISFLLAFGSFVPALLLSVLWVFLLDTTSKIINISLNGLLIIIMSFTPLTLAIFVIILIDIFKIPVPIFYGGGIIRYIIPMLVLCLIQIPVYVQSLLASLHIIKTRPYVTFTRALGFSKVRVWWKTILPNALLFTTGVAALQLGVLLGGTILIEYVFSLSGLGSLLVYSVYSRDIMVIQALVLLSAIFIAIIRETVKKFEKKVFFV